VSSSGKLFALLVVFVAIGLATATGAFTTVQADRTATVSVAGDEAALLALEPVPGSPASIGNNGQLQIELENVNPDAVTTFEQVINVTNNGEDTVVFYVHETDGDHTAAIDAGVKTSELVTDNGTESDGPSGEGIAGDDVVDISSPGSGPGTIGVQLEPGESITVGLYIDTSDANVNDGLQVGDATASNETEIGKDNNLWESVEFVAEADADHAYEANSE
jgi:hypothetical protein